MLFVPLALAADLPVPLPLDHDFFVADAGPGPYYRVAEPAPLHTPILLDFDAARSPDAFEVSTNETELAVGRPARTVYLLAAGFGGIDNKGIAADGELRFADGRSQALKWMVGEQLWPAWAGATGRSADVVYVGKNPGGRTLTASLLTVDVAWPDVPLRAIAVKTRPGQTMELLAVTTSDDPPKTVQVEADRTPFDSIPWRIPSALPAPLPGVPANPPLQPLHVDGGHLVNADGTRARFWGVNLVGNAALPTDPSAEASSLARFGFDLVRLHHIDDETTLLDPDRGTPGHGLLRADALDRFDRFFAELGKAGIAVFGETWTKRAFRADEGVPSPENVPVGNKYAGMYWPEWREAQEAWFKALYDRVNPYTGKAYRDDPTLAVIELANENSLLAAWHAGALEKLPPAHRRRLDELWNAWLRTKYGDDDALALAWVGPGRAGLQLGEALQLDSVAREPSQRSRTELYPARRAADLVSFYGELEANYFRELSAFVRGLGFRQPLVCTSSFGVPAADALLGACDVVDLHLYWDSAAESTVFTDTSILQHPGRWMEKVSWCQDGLPCTVSELDHTWPNRHEQEAPLFWAALGARQDWDAVVWFAWSHDAWKPDADGPDGSLDVQGRTNFLAQLPAAAALFRGGTAVPVRTFVKWWSPDAIFRDLSEPNSLWLDPTVGWRSWFETKLRTSFRPTPPEPTPATRDASPFSWTEGRLSGLTDTLAFVIGDGDAGPLHVAVESYAAVSLLSLDGRPLATSTELLLTAVGRAEREGTLWSTGGPSPLVLGRGPIRLERLHGRIAVDGRFSAVALGPTGADGGSVGSTRRGVWSVDPASVASAWVRLRRRP